MDQRIIDLYMEYTHAPLRRRVFLDRLAMLVGGTAATSALLPLIENNYALAAVVDPDDARLVTGSGGYAAGVVDVAYYVARPAESSGPWPAVLVIHENRGLNPHIEDVARRVALEGYLAIAPDMLSSLGRTLPDEDAARGLFGRLDNAAVVSEVQAGLVHLAERQDTTGRNGIVGFCWGGGQVNNVTAHPASEHLHAAVAYYGPTPSPSSAASVTAPLLLHYAGNDNFVNSGIADYTGALTAAGKTFEAHTYEGVQHAFNNDTNAARYNAEAAALAWSRTVEFFVRHLKS
jgi:carboxymethylenebutenolidase